MSVKSTFGAFKSAFSEFNRDNVLTLSAALAYYAAFSIGPLLAIGVGLAGLAFGKDAVRHEIHQTLQGMVGPNAAKTVDSMMAARSHGASLWATIGGIAALLFGAISVFSQLQSSLNIIWKVEVKPKAGIWAFLRNRLLSLSMVLGVCFLLLVSLALSVALAALTHDLNQWIPFGGVFGYIADVVVSLAVITLVFALIFKYLPDVAIPWSKVWAGAIGTACLFSLGKFLLGLYLGKESTASAYGAAGSVIVILMWVYYASVIFLFGAEFTRTYVIAAGVKLKPTRYARFIPVCEPKEDQSDAPQAKPRPQPV